MIILFEFTLLQKEMHIKHTILTYDINIRKVSFFFPNTKPNTKSVVIFFLEQNPFPQHQEFPAFMYTVVFFWFVLVAIHLFLDSRSFLAVKLEA